MKSFSKDVKEELGNLNNLNKKELIKFELKGYFSVFYNDIITSDKIEFVTDSSHNINRYMKLLNNVGINDFEVYVKGNYFYVKKDKAESKEETNKEEKEKIKEILKKECKQIEEKRAFARGCFLGAGSVTDPKTGYHLEIVFDTNEKANELKDILKESNISSNIIPRNKKYVLYIKEANTISEFLAYIEATNAVIKFEENRVYKNMSNYVNRITNIENANLEKTIWTSVKQIEAIKKLKKSNKYNMLNNKEKELAELRIKYPEASLSTLAKMLNPPMSKSGVNHRLKKIEELANNLESEK